jgi:hypothetical protein
MWSQPDLSHEDTMTHNGTPQSNPSSNHHPDMPPNPGAEASRTSGRGPNGRFAKGNPGGPGNPFARQVAAFRQEFMAAVTGEDLAVIVRALIDKAKDGDCAAARLVLQYTLGKPAATADPDRLDEMEWEQWQREQASADSDKVWTGMHAATANAIARTIIPVMQKEHFAELGRQLREREEDRREEDAEDDREAGRQEERQARRAAKESGSVEAAPVMPGKVATPAAPSTARAQTPKGGEAANASPVEAQKDEQDGQEATAQSCADAATSALRALGITVSKRDETARRAANAFTD